MYKYIVFAIGENRVTLGSNPSASIAAYIVGGGIFPDIAHSQYINAVAHSAINPSFSQNRSV